MSDFISRELLASNTTNPDVRHRCIDEQMRLMATGSNGDFLKDFGVRILGPPSNTVPIGIRAPPTIDFGDRKNVQPKNAVFDERNYRYYRPGANIKKWLIGYPGTLQNEIKKHGSGIRTAVGRKGYQLPEPEYKVIEFNKMEEEFKWIADNKYDFFMYIDNKRVKSHDLLKVMESRYKIQTQHVTAEVLQKAGGATFGNIANKVNMKLYGLNYVPRVEKLAGKFELEQGKVLVLGYDISHPAPCSGHEKFKMREKGIKDMESMEPSVVGICANYAKEPANFVGDYFYQPARKEAAEPEMLKNKMTWILKKVKENRPTIPPPPVIFVVRDGLSEGQFPMAVNDELPALKAGCRDWNPSYNPKFIFVIVTRRHNKRFFVKEQNGQIVNTQPGSVIDRKIVRADVPEFYMQSHRPLKGTAKVPQYAIAVKEFPEVTTDEIQAFINALCHSHQIVNSATSIPTPVYQAHELAKRGRANFMIFKQRYPQFVPKEGDVLNYAELTKRLGYANSHLSNTRFTA